MLRLTHSLPGLIVALLLAVLAISGAALSVYPTLERLGTPLPTNGQISVALLAERVAQRYPNVEQIQRSPSGSVIVYYNQGNQVGAERVNPLTGQGIGPYAPSSFMRWLKNLHRSFLLDTTGRAIAGLSALAMLILCFSGMLLLIKRQGGWRQFISPIRGSFNQRWHAEIGRIVILGLMLSALTGIYMSAATFSLIPDATQDEADFPSEMVMGPTMPIGTIPTLLTTDLNDLRELVYPLSGSLQDVYFLRTSQGDGYIDQASGALISYQAHSGVRSTYELIYKLHTGEGLWWLGLILGLCALTIPVMSVTGITMWWQRRRSMPRITNNSSAQSASIVILVGSENNSTWGFAKALHDAMHQAGLLVHTTPMNSLATEYSKAQHLFVLTATYGDGEAPASANQFLERLNLFTGNNKPSFTVLGFGDRQFPNFCKFAIDTQNAMLAQGWHKGLDLETIDRQSTQEFFRWGKTIGQMLNCELSLAYTPTLPKTRELELISRADYGVQVQAPTSILRFGPVVSKSHTLRLKQLMGFSALPHFEAGDLVGIVPPESPVPRFYSLASKSKDGFLEICVRRHPKGVCSQMLYNLQPRERINAFIRPNPQFRPNSGRLPIILIGAGTGIGPLAGFIRNNTGKYPMYLYWGGRDPASDFLYKPELDAYLADNRLTQLNAAFSRIKEGSHVQDRVLSDALQMRQLIESGAQILVCGGRAMATSIVLALNEILAPVGLDVQTLKTQGRYREDVF